MTPYEAYRDAFNAGKRLPEIEPIIATDEEAEATIATDAKSSFYYASYVVKGKWEKGEFAITKDPKYSCRYAEEVLM